MATHTVDQHHVLPTFVYHMAPLAAAKLFLKGLVQSWQRIDALIGPNQLRGLNTHLLNDIGLTQADVIQGARGYRGDIRPIKTFTLAFRTLFGQA